MPPEQPDALAETFARILCERASFELREEDVQAYRRRISSMQQAAQVSAASRAREEEEYRAWQAEHPALLDSFEAFAGRTSGKRLAVFLDYDGTLTPIVKDPDRAFMSDQMREAVRAVAQLFPTAIISGRGREKVEGFVRLKELYYAGSHGMDIVGPRGDQDEDGSKLAFQPAARFAPVMDQVYSELTARVAGIEGATVEHNKFCVSVHFRNCRPDAHDAVLGAVEATLRQHSELHATRGRKVFEIRPQVDWDKGSAVLHLLGALGLAGSADCLPLYIGDDRTDEDAFRALAGRSHPGIGILVSSKVKLTEAGYTLRDPAEVLAFLARLVAWGRTPANAWHAKPACIGWALVARPLHQPNGLLPNGHDAPSDEATNGGANGGASQLEPQGTRAAPGVGKFGAFGLQVPRGARDPSMRSASVQRAGRPPLAPGSATSSCTSLDTHDLRAPSGSLQPVTPAEEACMPPRVDSSAQASEEVEGVSAGQEHPKAPVDLSALTLEDTEEPKVAAMLTAAVARSPATSGSDAPVMLQLANGFEASPFSALSTAQDVLAGLGLPRGGDTSGLPGGGLGSGSGTLSGGYSSGGESMHLTPSGTLVADGDGHGA